MYIYHKNKHKVFISFYHYDDQTYKDDIDNHLSDNIINKSVKSGEYDTDNSDEYIKRLIREDKVSDSSVVVVLVGNNTKKRKHVDWEIYAGLSASINGSSGLVGILLPTFSGASLEDIPARLADNVKSGYAKLYSWNDAVENFDSIIQEAFDSRISKKELMANSRPQKKYNS
jgi:hypothetical protein